ncbi:MAG: hypothetical protein U0L18_00530 [Acutalibacteraceae bacterium]|nr:hypothetical protein [Acutalibacteraceae bacterium]
MENNTTQVQNAPNKQLLINQEEFTGFIISKIKDHSPAGTAPLEAFKTFVNNLFYYSTGRINYAEELTQQEYYNAFCGFILSELTYNEFISDEYFNLIFAYYGFSIKASPLDNDYFDMLQRSIREEQEEAQQLHQRTQELIAILDRQCVPDFPIFDIAEALNSKGRGYTFTILTYLFNYGYIEGKRAERRRRKTA